AVAYIDIDLPIGQIPDAVDLGARQQMEFLVVELGNVGNRRLYPREQLLLPRVIQGVRLEDGNVDAVEKCEISEVRQRPCADHRPQATGCPVIDDICEILGDTHRDAGRAPGLQLDDPSVYDDRVRRGQGRPCDGAHRRLSR